jgi:hypothetical protein
VGESAGVIRIHSCSVENTAGVCFSHSGAAGPREKARSKAPHPGPLPRLRGGEGIQSRGATVFSTDQYVLRESGWVRGGRRGDDGR